MYTYTDLFECKRIQCINTYIWVLISDYYFSRSSSLNNAAEFTRFNGQQRYTYFYGVMFP